MTENIYRRELQKANGDVFCEIKSSPDHAFISVHWTGIQSLETIVMGYNQVLHLLRQNSYAAILNNHTEVIGPWDIAHSWLVNKWAPQAQSLGLHYFAHVLSYGIFGNRSYQKLEPVLKQYFHVKAFENESAAKDWIYLYTL